MLTYTGAAVTLPDEPEPVLPRRGRSTRTTSCTQLSLPSNRLEQIRVVGPSNGLPTAGCHQHHASPGRSPTPPTGFRSASRTRRPELARHDCPRPRGVPTDPRSPSRDMRAAGPVLLPARRPPLSPPGSGSLDPGSTHLPTDQHLVRAAGPAPLPYSSLTESIRRMSRRYVNQLSHGDSVDEAFLVADKQLRANRQGNLYLQLELRDKTGSVGARLWNATEELARSFEPGDYLHVRGKTQIFQGSLQIILTHIDVLDPQPDRGRGLPAPELAERRQADGPAPRGPAGDEQPAPPRPGRVLPDRRRVRPQVHLGARRGSRTTTPTREGCSSTS